MTISGTVHGDTIKLDRSVGLPDGHRVDVDVHPHSQTKSPEELQKLRELLAKTFGALKDEADEVDEFVRQVRRDRDEWI